MEKPATPLAPAELLLERGDVKVAQNRCPYCHDDVSPLGDEDVCCKVCLARHHVACWDESRACAFCGHPLALRGPSPESSTQRRPLFAELDATAATALALSVLAGVICVAGLYTGYEGPPHPLALGSATHRPGFQPSVLGASTAVALCAGLGCLLAWLGLRRKRTPWAWAALTSNLLGLVAAAVMSQLVA